MKAQTRPARRDADDQLFDRTSERIKKLQKQSRAELREKARKQYWAEQKADAQTQPA